MASLNFPSNPTEGQEYTANGTTWVFTNDKWIVSVPEPVVSINDLSDAFSNTSLEFLSLGFDTPLPTSGSTVIGIGALSNATGIDNTGLGRAAGNSATTASNIIVVGANSQPSATNAANEITLGNNLVSRFRIPGLSLDTNDATSGQLLGWDGTDFSWIDNTAITGGFATETYVDTAVTGLASETYVDTAISDLANSAPATLDTLNELAAALGDDANFATTVTNSLAAKANTADLATVATSGSYDDLTDTPSIPVTTTVTSNGTFVSISDAAIETYYGGTGFAGNPDRQYIAINSQFAYSNTYPGGSEVYGAPNLGGPQLLISAMPDGNGLDPYANMSGSIIIGGGNAIDATPGDQPGLRATIVGIEAMAKSTYPQYTTAIGYRALNRINQSSWNTVVGMYAASGLTNGANNTIVGHLAGSDLDEGWNNIIIGANAQSSSNTSNNEITLGNENITKIRIPGISGWEVREATDSLIFTVGGNDVMQLFANGDMTITGSINVNGTI